MNKTAETIAAGVTRLLEARGRSWPWLAGELGIPAPNVYGLKRGEVEPQASRLRAIADALGVGMDDLLPAGDKCHWRGRWVASILEAERVRRRRSSYCNHDLPHGCCSLCISGGALRLGPGAGIIIPSLADDDDGIEPF